MVKDKKPKKLETELWEEKFGDGYLAGCHSEEQCLTFPELAERLMPEKFFTKDGRRKQLNPHVEWNHVQSCRIKCWYVREDQKCAYVVTSFGGKRIVMPMWLNETKSHKAILHENNKASGKKQRNIIYAQQMINIAKSNPRWNLAEARDLLTKVSQV